jgi:hypothetical protein
VKFKIYKNGASPMDFIEVKPEIITKQLLYLPINNGVSQTYMELQCHGGNLLITRTNPEEWKINTPRIGKHPEIVENKIDTQTLKKICETIEKNPKKTIQVILEKKQERSIIKKKGP